MVVLVVFGVLVVVACVWFGAHLVLAGRQLEQSGRAETGLATKVDARLHRTRAAVETLVMPEVDEAELGPSRGAHQLRAQTYSVLGLGLLGVAAALAIGVLLVL